MDVVSTTLNNRERSWPLSILKGFTRAGLSRKLLTVLLLGLFACSGLGPTATVRSASRQEVRSFFQSSKKTVVTFVGYSGAGYEDQAAMLKQAEHILSEFDPQKTIVNIGATPEGIGGIYELAKRKGFVTTGIVSSQAKRHNVQLSPYVDYVFYVDDAEWGGFLNGTERLSATSEAMIENSDVVIGIGGGEIARDELIAARRSSKKVRFIPADMNHQKARETARKKGLPEPDFRGAAHGAF
ncbi:MAG TPA: hypothetical protein VIH18_31800 [Candidatus Binatia bacterium]